MMIKQDQNLIIARGNLRETLSYYIFVPHFVLQKSIIGSLPLSRREQKVNEHIQRQVDDYHNVYRWFEYKPTVGIIIAD